ncbi:hypothetical protein M0804_010628 [Polistes exclamans]|nr:hypothetical protein M0804_010628 [Polistes exclamans]
MAFWDLHRQALNCSSKKKSSKIASTNNNNTIIQDDNDYTKLYDFKKINQPILENSNRPLKPKKNLFKPKFGRQYLTEIPGIMKRDVSGMTESNNEKFNYYYPGNYWPLNDGFASVSKMKLSKDCHHCSFPSCPLNIYNNNNLQIDKNPNVYSNDNECTFKSNTISYDNCRNCNNSNSSLIEKYPDWINNENIDSFSNLHGCGCSEKNETCSSQECTPSKASLFVETSESMVEFSTSWPLNSKNLTNVCSCSNGSSMIEEHSTTMNEDVQRDGPFEKEEEEEEDEGKGEGVEQHAMIDKCGARCKSRDFKHEPCCCSHFTSKKHSSIENSTWNQIEMVESKTRRLDYGRRENIRRRDVGTTSSNVRSVTKRPRYYESEMGNTSERHGIPKNCQNSFFGDFEMGKVWSRVHDTCKNFVQSAITNIGQAIKDISRLQDTSEDKENDISDCLLRNSKGFIGKGCSKSCQQKK